MHRANVLAREANDAAREANTVNAKTLWWTRAGFIAIFLTLIATAWAAWAAARAASVASKSMGVFQAAESAFLAPQVKLARDGSAIGVGAVNRGKTPALVIVADLAFSNEPYRGPVPVALTTGYEASVLIATGDKYSFGTLSLKDFARIVFIVGGILYRNSFGQIYVAKIAMRVDRQAATYEITHDTDFSKWDRLADKMNAGGKLRTGDL